MTLYCDSYRDVNSVLGDRTGETFVDGWVYTGDEVMINDTGELFIVDRIKVCGLLLQYTCFLMRCNIQELLKVKGFQGEYVVTLTSTTADFLVTCLSGTR